MNQLKNLTAIQNSCQEDALLLWTDLPYCKACVCGTSSQKLMQVSTEVPTELP